MQALVRNNRIKGVFSGSLLPAYLLPAAGLAEVKSCGGRVLVLLAHVLLIPQRDAGWQCDQASSSARSLFPDVIPVPIAVCPAGCSNCCVLGAAQGRLQPNTPTLLSSALLWDDLLLSSIAIHVATCVLLCQREQMSLTLWIFNFK